MNTQLTESDLAHLRRALELAEHGRGRVSPNPLVGAVLVRDGEVIGAGFHAELGGLHAERVALAECRARGEDPAGATMYVTLEPCAHQGRQPPCVEALLEAALARVVIASEDPSEKANGRGPGMLRDGGVEVAFAAGAEAAAARLLNQPFRKHARAGLPLVTLKQAMSLDGQTATGAGQSPWISGESSRDLVHRWRSQADAIAVGIGTVLADDPLLTARLPGARQPLRIVFDSEARLPCGSQLLASLDRSPLLLVCAPDADPARLSALRDLNVEIITASGETPADRVTAALTELGRRNITSLFLEGGRTLASAFIAADQLDESRIFIAPTLLGAPAPATELLDPPPGAAAETLPRAGDPGGEREDVNLARIAPPRGQAPRAGAPLSLRLDALESHSEYVGEDVLITSRFREW